jgi:hypothetical protein
MSTMSTTTTTTLSEDMVDILVGFTEGQVYHKEEILVHCITSITGLRDEPNNEILWSRDTSQDSPDSGVAFRPVNLVPHGTGGLRQL